MPFKWEKKLLLFLSMPSRFCHARTIYLIPGNLKLLCRNVPAICFVDWEFILFNCWLFKAQAWSAILLDLSDFPTRSRFSRRAEMEGSGCVGERDWDKDRRERGRQRGSWRWRVAGVMDRARQYLIWWPEVFVGALRLHLSQTPKVSTFHCAVKNKRRNVIKHGKRDGINQGRGEGEGWQWGERWVGEDEEAMRGWGGEGGGLDPRYFFPHLAIKLLSFLKKNHCLFI